ncbi:acyl-CoA dehydrogenase family protein [Halococcus dombrowskii]|uniref:Acyl-CoA dehydrogenase family protein n=1 Tax=Halococcus dombrowskii TaxID=179637 RepID=A0AAV3SEN8_HALDO|nr:acyl-CoA dehydrogenase family protein [Halococcus dombrowskii]UOO94069.1 acyl-CoA dehydrogenase family protein [Halococcus dombrowskii]
MDYDDSATAQELRDRAREFMDEVVLPKERANAAGSVSQETIDELREQAREYDVYAPQISEEHGGMGIALRDVLPLFEEAGRSLLGAPAMRVDAPDEGNMHTLELVGTGAQKEEWLDPLVAGEIRSGFAMTEPAPGGGSDPKMLRTTAEKEDGEWVIDGHKWWTTQGSAADVLLVMARTDEEAHPYAGCSIILVPTDTEGVEIVRDIPHLGQDLMPESHAEIRFDGVRVPEENLLGEENEGFTVAQQRLGPARLTHCMRFSGMADRALDVAKAYMNEREAFGSSLADKQAQRFAIAEAETRLHAARTMVRDAATKLDAGEEARVEVSMSKVFAANVAQEMIDLAIQCCGGAGISRDLPLADFYDAVRAFRIVDGADEVHKRTIARAAFEDTDSAEIEAVPRFDG